MDTSVYADIFRHIEKNITIVHSGDMEEIPDGAETFHEFDTNNNKRLADAIMEKYGISASNLPVILHGGEVFSFSQVEEAKRSRQKKEEQDLEQVKEETKKKKKRYLLIKGTPEHPQCKFTRELLALLKSSGLSPSSDFGFFNVLDSDTVREGMKKHTDWPTYPQVFVDGEFVGGLDVLRAISAEGALGKSLKVGEF